MDLTLLVRFLVFLTFCCLFSTKILQIFFPAKTLKMKFKRKFLNSDKKNLKDMKINSIQHFSFLQRREVPWEKVPFVPRPSLIADPITAFGKKKSLFPKDERDRREGGSIVQQLKSEIKAKPLSQLRPLEDYKSPRDQTRDKVSTEIHRQQRIRESGGLTSYFTDSNSMDMILPRLHGKDKLPAREFRGPIF